MSTAATVQEVGPSKPSPASLTPEVRERILFARVMMLLIVPLYFLILLTVKDDARRWIRAFSDQRRAYYDSEGRKGPKPTDLVPTFRGVYRGMIVLTCSVTPLYCVLGLARLVFGRAGWKHALAAATCVLVGIGEAVGIAIAVFRYHVSL